MFLPENIHAFADHLYTQNDYANALNEYQRFTVIADTVPGIVHERIIDCLVNLGKYEDALQYTDKLTDSEKKTFTKGWIFFHAAQFDSSRIYLSMVGIPYKQDAQNIIGFGYACQFHFSEADDYLILPRPLPHYKKPSVAALYSLIPGGGHLYTGRPGDAIFSFLMVSTAALLSYYYHNEDEDLKFGICLCSAMVLYASNIYAGINAARNYNYYQNEQYLLKIIEANK